MNPQPVVTRYNKLALGLACCLILVLVAAYFVVIKSHSPQSSQPHKSPLTTIQTPLLMTEKDLPSAGEVQPDPIKEQPYLFMPKQEVRTSPPPVVAPPLSPPPATITKPPNPLVQLRLKELQDGLRSPMIVAASTSDRAAQRSTLSQGDLRTPDEPEPLSYDTSHSHLHPQALEVPPVDLPDEGGINQGIAPRGAKALQSQYLSAQLRPPMSSYQLNAGMQLPVVLSQDITSDVQSFFSAIVTRDVYDSISSRYLLVPAGSRITHGHGPDCGRGLATKISYKLAIKPTVVIRAGYPFSGTVTQYMIFPGPYRGT